MPIPSARWQAVLLALLLAAAALAGAVEGALAENDFDGFHAGAAHLLAGDGFSDAKAVERYPPSFVLLMAPFGALPLGVAAALFTLLSVAALLDLPWRLARLTGIPPTRQSWAWWALLPFTLDVLRLGQNGIVLLWLVVTGLAWCRARRGEAGGALLAVAGAAKLLPAAFLLVPVVLRRGARGLLGAALVLALLAGAAALGPGLPAAADASADWWARSASEQTPWALVEVGRSVRFNNQGLGVVLARTLGDMGPPRALAKGAVQLAAWPLPVVWTLYALLALLAALAALAALRAARRLGGELAWAGLLAVGCCAILLASPLVWTHYFVWLAPALVLLHARAWLRRLALPVLWLGLLPEARGLGAHIWVTLALLLLVTLELERRLARAPRPAGASPAATRAAAPAPSR